MVSVKYFFSFFSISILVFLFFFKLSFQHLESFDEAWYADISRNIILKSNPLDLTFNQQSFTDHPPFGFSILAVAHLVFGESRFAIRFMPALAGVLSVILVFLIGKSLKNNFVGLGASFILLSSLWFMLRARSGNLDIIFVFLSLLSTYFLLRIKEHRKFIYFFVLSFSFLILTKTLIGFGLLPLIFYIFYLYKEKFNKKDFLFIFILFFLIVSPWYLFNYLRDKSFLKHHFLDIGLRSEKNNFSLDSLTLSLFYLRVGIGKWFKIFLLSFIFSPLLLLKKNKNIVIIFLFLIGFLLPLLVSSEIEVWHLIPVYAPISLLISYVIFSIFDKNSLVKFVFLSLIFLISSYQFFQSFNLIYKDFNNLSEEEEISIKGKNYEKIFLLETFYPLLVYYSEAKVAPLYLSQTAYQELSFSLLNNKNDVYLVGKQILNQLDKDNLNYEILDKTENYFYIK